MPPLIGPALIALIPAIEGATVLGVSVSSAVAYGITTIATIGAKFALDRIQKNKQKKTGDLQTTAITIKQPIPVRTCAVGQVRLGGALFYEDAIPLIYQQLILGMIHCEGPIEQIVSYHLNDTNTGVTAAPNTEVSGINLALPWGTLIALQGKLGTDTQTTMSQMNALRGWTGQLKGLACTSMVCAQPLARPDKYFQYFYPNGVPTLRATLKTAKIYDPRDGSQNWNTPSTWKYSNNSALTILYYLTFFKIDGSGRKVQRGMGIPHDMINTASFAAFANICDQTYISRYSYNSVDGTVIDSYHNEPRYRCDGAWQLDESPLDVLSRMLATCDGTLYTDKDGLVCIRGGNWEEPTVLINDAMIIETDISKGSGKYESFNRLKISFTATNMDYQVVEGPPLDDDADILDNGILQSDLSLPYVQSYSQSRRLAKIAMAKGNPEWTYNRLTCNLAALNCIGEEFVHVTHSLLGIDEPFSIHNVKIMLEQGRVELQLSSIDPEAYNWNASAEDAVPPSVTGVVSVGSSEVPGLGNVGGAVGGSGG